MVQFFDTVALTVRDDDAAVWPLSALSAAIEMTARPARTITLRRIQTSNSDAQERRWKVYAAAHPTTIDRRCDPSCSAWCSPGGQAAASPGSCVDLTKVRL